MADAAVEQRVGAPVGWEFGELANVQRAIEVARQDNRISSLVTRTDKKRRSHHQQGSAAEDRYGASPAQVESFPASPRQKVGRNRHREQNEQASELLATK